YNPNNFQGNGYNQYNQYGGYRGGFGPDDVVAQPGSREKTIGVVAYITLIGWIIALVMSTEQGQRPEFARFHLNQYLVILLFGLASLIPVIGWIWGIFIIVCWLIGFIGACQGKMKPVPLLGKITIIK
ncbi:MAG: hypothetical protein UHN88_07570, partial [Eubacterium sp.]|nr:hypothetical protein [Eubacterium sp.]